MSETLELDAVYTHFATAEDPSSPLFEQQRLRFERALADISALGARWRYRHMANSAALLRDLRVWFDRVRPGLLLYGIVPPPLASTLELTPVMTLGSRVIAVKGLRRAEAAGYGARSPLSARRVSRLCRPGTPTVSIRGSPAVERC